jgi:hypothetical protein
MPRLYTLRLFITVVIGGMSRSDAMHCAATCQRNYDTKKFDSLILKIFLHDN